MSKTQRIELINFKALSHEIIDFKGLTAIITGGNNKGKSSLLRGITDRIRGLKPELIVKQGEKEGKGTLELTTGEKFVWEFDNEGSDKLTFVTKEGYKTKVTKEIVKRFFPTVFDIDKFLNDSPKEQSKQLQKIIGIDFTEIDNRYKLAYDDRTDKNREAEKFHVKLTEMLEVPKVNFIDLTELAEKKETERKRLNDLYSKNKNSNDTLRKEYQIECNKIRKQIEDFNREQTINNEMFLNSLKALDLLKKLGYIGNEVYVFTEQLKKKIESHKIFEPHKEPEYIEEKPSDETLQKLDEQLLSASKINAEAKAYTDYISYKLEVEAAKVEAADAEIKVKSIEDEREALITSAKMPVGITIDFDGIKVDGFPLDKNQISTSKLYCAALRIASLNIGEVRTLHFDASFLDKNTLAEIEVWAEENDLQLLIERADYDAGEIKYELIEN